MTEFQFHPARALASGFLAAIALGTALLLLPFSTPDGRIPFIDALFTAASAVCVTGLTVRPTGAAFTPAGQAVILGLIQLGGLGIMTFSSFLFLAAGRRVSFRDRLFLQDSLSPGPARDFGSLLRSVFGTALAVEAVGAAALSVFFVPDFGVGRGAALAVFHAVSAFCNAGFSLFPDNLAAYRGHAGVNLVVCLLIVAGGLGFFVLRELAGRMKRWPEGERPRLSLHSRTVLVATVILIAVPAGLFFFQESAAGLRGLAAGEKLLASLFQVVTARTAGFQTIDLRAVSPAGTALLVALMFVGASPGSAGGGVKTTTAAVVLAHLRAVFQKRESVALFRRSVPAASVLRAYAIVVLAAILIAGATALLVWETPAIPGRDAAFEAVSALGTVGLSRGLTAGLTPFGKVVIIALMYVGRVGPLTLLLALGREAGAARYAYAEEGVLVG